MRSHQELLAKLCAICETDAWTLREKYWGGTPPWWSLNERRLWGRLPCLLLVVLSVHNATLTSFYQFSVMIIQRWDVINVCKGLLWGLQGLQRVLKMVHPYNECINTFLPFFQFLVFKSDTSLLSLTSSIQLKIRSDVLVQTRLCGVDYVWVKKSVLTYIHPLPYFL